MHANKEAVMRTGYLKRICYLLRACESYELAAIETGLRSAMASRLLVRLGPRPLPERRRKTDRARRA